MHSAAGYAECRLVGSPTSSPKHLEPKGPEPWSSALAPLCPDWYPSLHFWAHLSSGCRAEGLLFLGTRLV